MTKILHIVLNNYENDNRVRRSAECGIEMGFDVSLFALSKYSYSKNYTENGVKIELVYLTTRSWPKVRLIQAIKYLEVLIRMIILGVKKRPDIIHAHDLNALPIGYFIAKFIKAKLIYDSHEYWADAGVFGSAKSIITKFVLLWEKYFIRRVNVCITVSDSIADLLSKDYNIIRPTILRNVPEIWVLNGEKKLRSSLNIDKSKKVILYQGIINGEGVFDLINAFKILKHESVLVFLGNGDAVSKLKEMSVQNVYFHPSVPYNQLPFFTSDADIGVHSMHGNMLNRLNALPNKLFEYIQGNLAIVVSDLPEMTRVVKQYNLGFIYPYGNIEFLASCLDKLVSDENLLSNRKHASFVCANELNWDSEKRRLIDTYKKLAF